MARFKDKRGSGKEYHVNVKATRKSADILYSITLRAVGPNEAKKAGIAKARLELALEGELAATVTRAN